MKGLSFQEKTTDPAIMQFEKPLRGQFRRADDSVIESFVVGSGRDQDKSWRRVMGLFSASNARSLLTKRSPFHAVSNLLLAYLKIPKGQDKFIAW